MGEEVEFVDERAPKCQLTIKATKRLFRDIML